MPIVKFNAYQGGGDVFVNTDHVLTFQEIRYNGNPGTEFRLSTGRTIIVGEWAEDVAKKIDAAVGGM